MDKDLLQLKEKWFSQWQEALALWSKFTKLREPRWCLSHKEAKLEQLEGSFAMIRLTDHAVVIDIADIHAKGLDEYALEIMAHEIGHHVYCPADLTDQGRMLARMRRALPSREQHAPLVANLYADLLINDRLQRGANLRMDEIYKKLGNESKDRMWTFYMRIYEILWRMQKGTIAKGDIDATLELDAQLGARVVRAYAKDWLKGAGRFAALCLTYLIQTEGDQLRILLKGWIDIKNSGAGTIPDGLIDIDVDEAAGAIHPMEDEELSGVSKGADTQVKKRTPTSLPPFPTSPGGQAREPFEYGEILRGLGVNLSAHELAIHYYRERSIPHLVKFPYRELPESKEPLIEGLDIWDIGSPMEEVDWFESAMVSPQIVPGITTVQRVYGTSSGSLPEREPLDLDLYVDCSGSMPNPQLSTSYLTLAGAIIVLSALRAGSRVKATLWSGKHDFQTTHEFTRDEKELLKILTGYIGGATAFPIHLLRDTFKDRTLKDRPVHILVISDDGVDTMFDKDERNTSGWEVAKMALKNGRGGGTMVLNLWNDWKKYPVLTRANEEGWKVHRVQDWNQLVEFARAFSKEKYGKQ